MSLSTASGVNIGLELGERRGSDNIGVDEGGAEVTKANAICTGSRQQSVT
jgi:hypothetical protein